MQEYGPVISQSSPGKECQRDLPEGWRSPNPDPDRIRRGLIHGFNVNFAQSGEFGQTKVYPQPFFAVICGVKPAPHPRFRGIKPAETVAISLFGE